MANATCNAGGKLLKVVEMQYRFGDKRSHGNGTRKVLELVPLTQGAESVQ